MNERPADVADAAVTAILREHWGLAVTRLRYLPVGYGGYHWAATVTGGRRFFVTLSAVTGDDGFTDLAAAMAAAASLAPERDLWWVLPDPPTDPDAFAALGDLYTDLGGRAVNPAAVTLYRLGWDLDDIRLFLADFRAPHQRTADTKKFARA